MAYFWINAKERYPLRDGGWMASPNGMLQNYIWAPLLNEGGRDEHHWKTLDEINPNDLIFISVRRRITAVALAIKTAVKQPAPNDFFEWDGIGRKVEVNYTKLDKALSVDHLDTIIGENLRVKYGPLTKTGRKNQGYCYKINDLAGDYIADLISKQVAINQLSDNEQQSYEFNAFRPNNLEDARRQTMAAIKVREGQSKFKEDLLDIYEGKCAISASSAAPVLEAAHIVPYMGRETNHPLNGILLRADIHTLFDKGLIVISPNDYSIKIDPCLKNTEYAQYNGMRIRKSSMGFPSKEALEIKKDL